jgi:phosphoserine phosphatase
VLNATFNISVISWRSEGLCVTKERYIDVTDVADNNPIFNVAGSKYTFHAKPSMQYLL